MFVRSAKIMKMFFSSWCIRLLDFYLDPPLNADPDPDTATVLYRILLKAEIHYAWQILISTIIQFFVNIYCFMQNLYYLDAISYIFYKYQTFSPFFSLCTLLK